MRHKYLFLALILLAATGCKKESTATTTVTPVVFSFTGTWKWVKAEGGIAGITETPASTGHTLQYTFHADSSMIITTDTSTVSTTFSTSVLTSLGGHTNLITIGANEPKSYGYYSDTLVLTDLISDGFAYFFVKQ